MQMDVQIRGHIRRFWTVQNRLVTLKMQKKKKTHNINYNNIN